MRAKHVYSLLLVFLAGMVGCSARMSVEPATHESRQREDAMLLGQLGADKEAEAGFNEALALIAELRYSQARMRLLPLIKTFESAGELNRVAEATFWVGYCYEKEGRTDDAVEYYNSVSRRYPQTSASRQANERLFHLSGQSGD